jgi:hypothetical protein
MEASVSERLHILLLPKQHFIVLVAEHLYKRKKRIDKIDLYHDHSMEC